MTTRDYALTAIRRNTTANTCPAPGTTTIPKSHGHSTSYMAIVLGIVAILLDATAPASVSASCTAPGAVPARTTLTRSNRPGRVEIASDNSGFSEGIRSCFPKIYARATPLDRMPLERPGQGAYVRPRGRRSRSNAPGECSTIRCQKLPYQY